MGNTMIQTAEKSRPEKSRYNAILSCTGNRSTLNIKQNTGMQMSFEFSKSNSRLLSQRFTHSREHGKISFWGRVGRLLLLPLVAACLFSQSAFCQSQTLDKPTSETENAPVASFASQFSVDEKLQKQFDDTYNEWRGTVIKIQELGVKFNSAKTSDESENMREQFNNLIAEGQQQMERFVPVALQLFKANGTVKWKTDNEAPLPQRDLDHLITLIQQYFFSKGRFDKSFELGTALLANNPENQPADLIRRRSAVLSNRFYEVGDIVSDFEQELENLPDKEKLLFTVLPELASLFDQELAIREKEAIADNLPRVQMKTTKGTVVFELFEDQAPDTVGNFISLVEAKFYDGLVFHRVIDRFMVQGGGMNANEEKETGYTIYDEHTFVRNKLRLHFRGSLSMAKTSAPNSATSQFFVCSVPTPALNGKHTVFGRVIKGMDVIDRITKTEKTDSDGQPEYIPDVVMDKIISATVLRKRDHEYKPNIFE